MFKYLRLKRYIPLVEDYHNPTAKCLQHLGKIHVLLGDASRRVDHEKTDVSSLGRLVEIHEITNLTIYNSK